MQLYAFHIIILALGLICMCAGLALSALHMAGVL